MTRALAFGGGVPNNRGEETSVTVAGRCGAGGGSAAGGGAASIKLHLLQRAACCKGPALRAVCVRQCGTGRLTLLWLLWRSPVAHRRGRGHGHGHGHEATPGEDEKMHNFFEADPTIGLSREESRKHEAARHIQAAALGRVIGSTMKLKREMLLERLELELNLQRGLRLLLLCIALFVLVVYSMVVESTSPFRLGLLQTFKTVFLLDDSLADIKTLRAFKDYMKTLNQQTRLLMPLSTEYFSEHGGEIRIFEGTRSFEEKLPLNVRHMNPKVDTPEWTLTAWVQLEKEGGANIVRKPLGVSAQEKDCTCWGWYVGWPNDRFDYGAHDFAGSEDYHIVQETVGIVCMCLVPFERFVDVGSRQAHQMRSAHTRTENRKYICVGRRWEDALSRADCHARKGGNVGGCTEKV